MACPPDGDSAGTSFVARDPMKNQWSPLPAFDSYAAASTAREMLAWYAVGALSQDENEWMIGYMASVSSDTFASFQAETVWLRSAAQLVAADPVPLAPLEAGLRTLMQRIADEHVDDRADTMKRPRAAWQPLRWVLRERFDVFKDRATLRATFAAWIVVAVVAVQAAVIGALLHRQPAEQLPLSGKASAETAGRVTLVVAFRADVTESRLRELLLSHDAQLVSGPSAVGLYRLSVPAEKANDTAIALRRADTVVQSVQRD